MMYVCMYVYIYIHTCTSLSLSLHTHTHTHIYIYIHIDLDTRVYATFVCDFLRQAYLCLYATYCQPAINRTSVEPAVCPQQVIHGHWHGHCSPNRMYPIPSHG